MKLWCISFIICWAASAVTAAKARDKLFFLQKRGSGSDAGSKKHFLVVTWFPDAVDEHGGCEIFTDKELIEEVLRSSKNPTVEYPNEEEMQSLLEDCTEIALRRKRRQSSYNNKANPEVNESNAADDTSFNPISKRGEKIPENSSQEFEDNSTIPNILQEAPTTEEGYDGWPIIWIGTKWCGAGDIAKGYNDLGLHADTDMCCRAHDLCNDTMAPGETKNNLTNKSSFTKLSCQCDIDFYNCLDRVNSVTSNTIGNLYFNVLRRECYRKDYPVTDKCKRYRTFLKLKCLEYEKDTKKPKVNQWQPAKKYKKIPIPGPLTITLPF